MSETYTSAEQQADLMKFISDNISIPVLGAGGGFAPIGTINFFDASIAPQGWLACDGSTYNIADYPDLATYYASVHGSANFYGGNGTTTFAVPDLRGEFLRGTGTNSHENQGSGANVGVHQDGTEIPYIWMNNDKSSSNFWKSFYYDLDHPQTSTSTRNRFEPIKADSTVGYGNTRNAYSANSTVATEADNIQPVSFTARPTNTSFLICVKATVAGDPNAHHYSTEEQVVGQDEDGNTIYEKTIKITNASFTSGQETTIAHNISNIGEAWIGRLLWRDSDGSTIFMPMVSNPDLANRILLRKVNSSNFVFRTYGDSWTSTDYDYIKVTINYTKTS